MKERSRAMAMFMKSSAGWRPSGPSCMQIVPPVPMMSTLDSGRADAMLGLLLAWDSIVSVGAYGSFGHDARRLSGVVGRFSYAVLKV